jgi:hypothetical protein
MQGQGQEADGSTVPLYANLEAGAMDRSVRTLVTVIATTLLTIVTFELVLRSLLDVPPPLAQVNEGITELVENDPDTLLIGSSHARSFIPVAAELTRRDGRPRMAVIPVESGKWSAYAWVLEHRVIPALERPGVGGNLAQFIVVTDTWDACTLEGPLAKANIPARAWRLRDYVDDVLRSGVTTFNENFVGGATSRALAGSVLARGRERGDIIRSLRTKLNRSEDPTGQDAAIRLKSWQDGIETEFTDARCQDPAEQEGLEALLDWARTRKLRTVVMTFPRKPAVITERAKLVTRQPFNHRLETLAARYGAQFRDLASAYPVADEDFMWDWDHLTAAGNARFTEWMLKREKEFLLDPPGSR